jgi:hypothetical protein
MKNHEVRHARPARPISLRNLPAPVAPAIRRRAKERGLSLNRAAISLLEDALGGKKERSRVRHTDLDHLAGAWPIEEARRFGKALKEQRKVDPELRA